MQCPFCNHPVLEHTPDCLNCGMTVERVGKLFGARPRLLPGFSDLAGILRRLKRGRVKRALRNIRLRFPQVYVSVLIVNDIPAEASLRAWSFWIFNTAGVCPELEKGALNRTVLLTVDAKNRRNNLMVGYGLEPFVNESDLAEILGSGQGAFSRDAIAEGIEQVLVSLLESFKRIHARIPETYGLEAVA